MLHERDLSIKTEEVEIQMKLAEVKIRDANHKSYAIKELLFFLQVKLLDE